MQNTPAPGAPDLPYMRDPASSGARKLLSRRAPEPGESRTESISNSYSTAGLSNTQTASENRNTSNAIKRKRSSSPTRSRKQENRHPSLFNLGSLFKKIYAILDPTDETKSQAKEVYDLISKIPEEKLPMVTESACRIHTYGCRPYTIYQCTVMIKTNPSHPKLSENDIWELAKEMGYFWDEILYIDILSPEFTRAGGMIDPFHELDSSVSGSDSGNDTSGDDYDFEAEEDHKPEKE